MEQKDVIDLFRRGLWQLDNSSPHSALVNFNQIVNSGFYILGLYNEMGRAYSKLNNPNEALMYYHKSIEIDNLPVVYYNIGSIYFEESDYGKAISYFDMAIENRYESKLWDLYTMRSQAVMFKMEQEHHLTPTFGINSMIEVEVLLERAKNDILKAIELCPYDDTDIYFVAGNIFEKLGDIHKAKVYWSQASNMGDEEAKKKIAKYL